MPPTAGAARLPLFAPPPPAAAAPKEPAELGRLLHGSILPRRPTAGGRRGGPCCTPARRAQEDPALSDGRERAQAGVMDVPTMIRTGSDHALRRPSSGQVLVAALLGFFMLSLDATAVNVALPGIGRTLRGPTAGLPGGGDADTLD